MLGGFIVADSTFRWSTTLDDTGVYIVAHTKHSTAAHSTTLHTRRSDPFLLLSNSRPVLSETALPLALGPAQRVLRALQRPARPAAPSLLNL